MRSNIRLLSKFKLPIIVIVIVILIVVVGLAVLGVTSTPPKSKLIIVSMMKNPKNIDYWLDYHRKKGVTHFYIRLEDTPELEDYLSKQSDVYLTVGSSKDASTFSVEYDPQFARQRDLAKNAIGYALQNDIKWIAHIDSDELIECDGKFIQSTLEREIKDNPNTHNIIMDNYEAKYDKINNNSDSCFRYKKLINCRTEKGCVSYVNGKSIARVSDKLQELGPHRFKIPNTDAKDYEITSKKLRVLHFESCDFDSYVKKFINLSKHKTKDYPFEFYNKSIELAKAPACNTNDLTTCKTEFEKLYEQYKM